MAFTFNKVLNNCRIGKSLYDEEGAKIVNDIMKKANERGVKIHIPMDFVAADKFDENAQTMIRSESEGIDDEWIGLDIGPQTIAHNSEVIARSKTIFWNGPQGVFEMKPFSSGSMKMVDDVIHATKKGAISVAGGGDTVSLLKKVKGAS